ncbi:MAG TPA: hypothetical protein VFK05_37600 [Polyangiaceae bacterium]|nr:hypothetical protein [Polyangiaceae bacterium]
MTERPRNQSRAAPRAARLVWLGVLLFASGAAAGNPPARESSAQLRSRATRLFRGRQFAAACPLFEAALRVSPGEPELLTDLALCQHRLGQDALARQTNLEAVARASEPATRLSDPRFARVRRHAYFNMSELEAMPAPDEPNAQPAIEREVQCWSLPAEPGCGQTLHACAASRVVGSRSYSASATVLRVARSAEAAHFEPWEIDIGPDFSRLGAPAGELPVELGPESWLDFEDGFSEEELTASCEWQCEDSPAVAEEVSKCQSNPKLSSAARDRCSETVCARAERAPWAAVAAEQHDSDACYQYAKTVDGEYGCSVLYANACTGLVGLLCSGRAGGERKTLTRVEEYRFESAPAASASL